MRQRFNDVLEFWRFLWRRFFEDRSLSSAAGLTFTTMFAVVPMMTVIFVIISAIPAFQGAGEQIQGFILRNFLPASGAAVREYLIGFSTQARQLTWLGVLFIAITALSMLISVEKAFNTIWRVRQPRRGVGRFLLYWAVLSLGPLLLGAGFVASTYVASLALISGADARPLLRFAPLLSSVAAFTLIYAVVPNTRVSLRHAFVGGVLAALLFELAKALFGLYVRLFPGYQLIYGAFATVPLFLLWIYLSWLIVLFGAELVCSLSGSHQWRRRNLPRLLVLLGVLRLFHQNQLRGEPLTLADVQRQGWALPEDEWDELLEFLEAERLVCRVSGGGWALCRDMEHYSLHQLLSHSPWPLPRPEQLPEAFDEPWYPALREALGQLHLEQQALLGGNLGGWLRGNKG